MAYKNIEDERAYRRKWYKENSEIEKRRAKNRKQKKKDWFWEYKKQFSCSICGERHRACLEFHHLQNADKTKAVSQMVSDGFSIKKIIAEIEKCMPLCSNCHRKVHTTPEGKYNTQYFNSEYE